jgi:hypothetical protein
LKHALVPVGPKAQRFRQFHGLILPPF